MTLKLLTLTVSLIVLGGCSTATVVYTIDDKTETLVVDTTGSATLHVEGKGLKITIK